MTRISRDGLKVLSTWWPTVRRRLDYDAFLARAEEFEAIPLSDSRRTDGFATYAPEVLPPTRKKKPSFPSLWGSAKLRLTKMCEGKCAYCEDHITAVRLGQVEHFQPKSLFPSIAYDWDNYFLACGGCNGAKSDKWPDTGAYVRPDIPKFDPAHFEFSENGSVKGRTPDAEVTIKDFDLWYAPLG